VEQPGIVSQPTFRPLERGDLGLLAEWIARPHVEPWWREPFDVQSVEARYGPAIDGDDPTEVFVVEVGDEPIGIVQRYLISDDPGWQRSLAPAGIAADSVGIDYLIGVEHLIGRGIGPLIVGAFVAGTWGRYQGSSAIVVSVQQENRRSWRALEKCGFERVWSGMIVSDDPSDEGPSFVYVLRRPGQDEIASC
jgi:aminoglycoside 6'-N-acetyltransferase